MLPWLKRFFLDETAFVGLVRAALMAVGLAEMNGSFEPYLGELPDAVGIGLVAAAGFVRSSSHRKVGEGGKGG